VSRDGVRTRFSTTVDDGVRCISIDAMRSIDRHRSRTIDRSIDDERSFGATLRDGAVKTEEGMVSPYGSARALASAARIGAVVAGVATGAVVSAWSSRTRT